MKKTAQIIATTTLLPLFITACGGGGSSGSGTDNGSSSVVADSNTVPNDGPVLRGQITGLQGLRYETQSESGVTSESGQFDYRNGDTITFYVGDIALGSAAAAAKLDISDLAGGNQETRTNIEKFLLTLDYDLSPANGVLITSSIHDAARGLSLDFTQDSARFTREAESLVGKSLASEEHLIVFRHGTEELLPKAYQQSAARAAQQTLMDFSYPSVTREQIDALPGIEAEADTVFELMLGNTLRPGDSPLEYIMAALNTPLVLDRDAEGSLFDMYVEYKHRVNRIGESAPHIDREDFVAAINTDNLVDVQHFVVMSDFQMRDDESPLNVNPVKFLIPSSYYPASAHIAYQVDDMVRTLRNYEARINKPVEMAIFTGDFIDISQYNEVRLGIDVLDGGMIDPDTGIDDDPIPGTFADGKPNDTYDPFMALGLNGSGDQADIPWYYVAGNHDGLMLGNFPITSEPLNLFGKEIRGGTREFYDEIATGDLNWFGYDPSLLGFLLHFLDGSWKLEPDANRRVVDPADIAQEMFNSTSQPHGHGMQHVIEQQGSLDQKQHYSFESNNGLVRHIALDTNMPLGPEGWLTLQSLSWLRAELDAAVAKGQLVIVSSHHKPKDIIINGHLLIDILNQYPNVIAHLVAHSHMNAIRARAGKDALHSYWEIESGSMVNWPQQFRMLDIQIDPESGTGVMTSTMLNHSTDSPLHVSNRGRFLSYIERDLEGYFFGDGGLEAAEGLPEDRNTRLYFQVPDGVLNRL
ncbi:MAG: metallophosphoesterase [Ketobacteraceae bacterium]|nr:metallophosphoesterase [Ketobacteraceae bacterium]